MNVAEEDPAPPTEWLVTFADMMSLLLTFFILLVSLNELKQEKRTDQYQAMLNSLRRKFGETSPQAPAAPRDERKPAPPDAGRARRQEAVQGGPAVRPVQNNALAAVDFAAEPLVSGGTLWFAPNSDQLSSGGEASLRRIASVVESKPQKLEIRGYTTTAPLPADSAYQDPWDLAYGRARRVADRLIELGIQSRRLRLGIVATKDPNGNATGSQASPASDCVEVFLLDEFTDEIVETTQAQDAPHGNSLSR